MKRLKRFESFEAGMKAPKDIIDIYGETEDWILYGKRGF